MHFNTGIEQFTFNPTAKTFQYQIQGTKLLLHPTYTEPTLDNELICSLVFPVDKLKEILPQLPKKSVMGGDNNASKLQLVSLVKLMTLLTSQNH